MNLLREKVKKSTFSRNKKYVRTYADYVMYSFTKDRLLSTRLVSNPKGEVAVAKDFGAYGEPIDVFTREDVVDNNVNKARYTGHVYDDIAGLYYAKARTYDPRDKRFTSLDSVMDGLNRYEYCRSNPLKYTDPTGNSPVGTSPGAYACDFINEPRKYAEEDVLDNTGKAPYIGVLYLNRIDGAAGNGHTGIMLCRSDGTGDLYSYVSSEPSPTVIAGYSDANVNYAYGVDVKKFMSKGENKNGIYQYTVTDAIGYMSDANKRDAENRKAEEIYNRGIYISISNEQGMRIADATNQTILSVNGLGYDKPDYHLIFNNCDIQARKWLKAGGVDYILPALRPNNTYNDTLLELFMLDVNALYTQNRLFSKEFGIYYGDLSHIWENIRHKIE